MEWEILHLPGHSPGSIGLYNHAQRILIPGDVVYADHGIGRFDLHESSGTEHKDSLLTLAKLEVDILLPGHNRIVKSLPSEYIADTVKQWAPFLT
jgi:glyoxylase-like metal-dependent hydrolase (beta-lactamase superfamily II)